jgi:iron complex outermembrane receptor protein
LGDVTHLLDGAFQIVDASGPNFTNGHATPADVIAIVDARTTNSAATRTSGLDLSLDYGFELGSDRFNVELNGNKVFRFDNELTSASPWVHALNTPFNPVSWRARAGLSWQRRALSAFAFLNYTGSYRDNRGTRDLPVSSWTTVDAGIAFDGTALQTRWSKGLHLALNVQNLLDADPPKLLPTPGFHDDVGYDPVNASGRGRTITIQLRRSW